MSSLFSVFSSKAKSLVIFFFKNETDPRIQTKNLPLPVSFVLAKYPFHLWVGSENKIQKYEIVTSRKRSDQKKHAYSFSVLKRKELRS